MEWDQLTIEAQKHHVPTLCLFRERFQKAVLYGMAEQDAFSRLVFQGGTALRLCYQNSVFGGFGFCHASTTWAIGLQCYRAGRAG